MLSASQQLTAAGQAVRYLRSRFIVSEARCLCLFEAEDEAAVAALNEAPSCRSPALGTVPAAAFYAPDNMQRIMAS